MLAYCEQCRQDGLKHDFERITYLKPVFIKMFGQ
jgi:hypothetical protein